MFANIMVPLDGSTPASNALDVAIDLAQRYEANLDLVHVIQRGLSIEDLRDCAERNGFLDQVADDLENVPFEPPIAAGPMGVPVVVIPDVLLEKIGTLLLDAAAARARDKGVTRFETALIDGAPAAAILERAEAKKTDLITVGSRGLGGFTGFFLGSVSHKLVADATCPCVVVK